MNNVNDWSWDKPTEEGCYLMCFGDVETPDNIFYFRLKYDENFDLVDQDGDNLDDYSRSNKWAKLEFDS